MSHVARFALLRSFFFFFFPALSRFPSFSGVGIHIAALGFVRSSQSQSHSNCPTVGVTEVARAASKKALYSTCSVVPYAVGRCAYEIFSHTFIHSSTPALQHCWTQSQRRPIRYRYTGTGTQVQAKVQVLDVAARHSSLVSHRPESGGGIKEYLGVSRQPWLDARTQ